MEGNQHSATEMTYGYQPSFPPAFITMPRPQDGGIGRANATYPDLTSYSGIPLEVGSPNSVSTAQMLLDSASDRLYAETLMMNPLKGGGEKTVDIGVPAAGYSPSLELLQRSQMAQQGWAGVTVSEAAQMYMAPLYAAAGDERSGMTQLEYIRMDAAQNPARDHQLLKQCLEDGQEKQLCTFFVRTGTCAYGDRCKFKHPQDRPPPQLNTRGYPLRPGEPDCAHYVKKGWCAFGLTCKFNHPELGSLASFSVPPQGPYVTYNNVYAAPNMCYVPTVPHVVGSSPGYTPPTSFPKSSYGVFRPTYNGGAMTMVANDGAAAVEQLARAMQTLRMRDIQGNK